MSLNENFDAILRNLQNINELTQSLQKRVEELEGSVSNDVVIPAEKYDFNIYVGDYATLSICAYKRTLDADGNVTTDTANYHKFTVDMNYRNGALVARLLEDPSWADSAWLEYDAWESVGFIYKAGHDTLVDSVDEELERTEIAGKLLDWLDLLPDYEIGGQK